MSGQGACGLLRQAEGPGRCVLLVLPPTPMYPPALPAGLRVAYIDTQYAETGSHQFSVLIRGRIGIPASDANCTEELYRSGSAM